ncbi:hypothetical protein MNBD_GAMMA09-2333 [hydrothermal vent metagenome]|uniref:Transmembrane protein n=1 Tax=hydrothermal vent metagenome TaxID=652676 RepID=A0A3B0XUT7_9ZZZZ
MLGVVMQLDKIIIALRQRNPWEAMDLGVMLMRVLWPVIFIPWLILISIVLTSVLFFQSQGYFYFSLIFMWLIKPVYDSMLLFILSRSVFAEYPVTSDVYSSSANWLKTGLITTFSFWRLSLSRSFNMPVHLLEGLSGDDRKKRLQSLHRVPGSHSATLTIIGVHFEYVMTFALYSLIFYIVPEASDDYINVFIDNAGDNASWIMAASVIYALVIFILEPFYVASGFMLYLNRRTQLEGWDIELDFRMLVQRIQKSLGIKKTESGSQNDHV